MSFKSFLKFVEIQTKAASVIPFFIGTLYALYRYDCFNLINFIIMLVSLISFDMATTAINNYIDFKKAHKKEGYGYEEHNAMARDGISERTAVIIIFTLISVAVIFGVILTIRTNIVLLLIGAVSFLVGIFYTFGPIPISRMPLGEAFSGFFMGFVILFLSIYIHVYDKNIAYLAYVGGILSLNININEVFYIFLISIPTVSTIANIMLANNICDVEDDITNKRFTLVYYIGKENALKLFALLYYIALMDIAALVILKIAPITSIIGLLVLIPVYRNIKLFKEKPIKKETFIVSVKNHLLINLAQILLVSIALIIR